MLPHTAPFTSPQTFQVTLPDGHDVHELHAPDHRVHVGDHALNNPGGCFYHHCANITIGASPGDGGTASDAGGKPTLDAAVSDAATGSGAPAASSGGCSCSSAGVSEPLVPGLAGFVGLSFGLRLAKRIRSRRPASSARTGAP